MTDCGQTIRTIIDSGARVTRVRKTIVDIIHKETSPVSASYIKSKLGSFGLNPNKTTVYRELAFLLEAGIVKVVNFPQSALHYELASLPHHHHLVCSRCGSISKVKCQKLEESLKKLEDEMRVKGFEIREHNLEFIGICRGCS